MNEKTLEISLMLVTIRELLFGKDSLVEFHSH